MDLFLTKNRELLKNIFQGLIIIHIFQGSPEYIDDDDLSLIMSPMRYFIAYSMILI